MKRLIAMLFLCILLTGCSANTANKEVGKNSEMTAATTTEVTGQSTATQESQTAETEVQLSEEDKGWFIGTIGSAKIHAKIDISEKNVSGVYYYDKYKVSIKIDGDAGNELKGMKTISLTEDTKNACEFYGIVKTPDYIEGYWKDGEKILPMYLIKAGSGINPPANPDQEAQKFSGDWTGVQTSYFVGSYANIKVLFNDMLYFDLESHNGANMGSLTGLAAIDKGKAAVIFVDEYDGDVTYDFSVNNSKLHLDSNKYDYMCGAGVSNMTDYVKGNLDITVPDASEVGIVDTKEQADVFKKLVGDMYEDFISLTQATSNEDFMMDGKTVSVRNSYLRGLSNECIYVISAEHIYAAINTVNGIEYFTDDKDYAEKLPEPIRKWAGERDDIDVNYNYK